MIFLRPWAFVLLLILPLTYYLLKRYEVVSNPWHKYIEPVFLRYLSVGSNQVKKSMMGRFLLSFLWILFTIALSGPAFDKMPVSGAETAMPTVLIVDLNTLNAEKTSLLQIKLYELLENLKENSVGLVLYDTKGYIAVPLTQDKELIKALVPSLKSNILPDSGNHLEKGIEKAIELFKNTNHQSGRILILTGGTPDVQKAKAVLQNIPFSVGVLGIGFETNATPVLTRDGAFLRDMNGNLVLEKPDEKQLEKLGVFYQTTPNGDEVKKLINETNPLDLSFLEKSEESLILKPDVWQDLGVYLVLAALPFAALLFQKGLFFLFLMSFLVAGSAEAGLWLRPDQEDYREIEKGNQLYRQGNYEAALQNYEKVNTVDALYNQANARAHLKLYQEAVDLYKQVLAQNPDHADAQFNKEYLEEQLKQQNQSQNDQSQDNQSQDNQSQDNQSQDNQSQDNQSQDNQSQDNQSQDNQSQNNQSQNKSEQQNHQTDENTENSSQNTTQSEKQNQAENQSKLKDQVSQETSAQADEGSDSSDSAGQNTDISPSSGEEFLSDMKDGASAYEETENTSKEQDQETQQILNRLQKDPSRVLRFRLRKQYLGV